MIPARPPTRPRGKQQRRGHDRELREVPATDQAIRAGGAL